MEALTSMGFEESDARQALARCEGNVERALDLLLGGFSAEPTPAAHSSGGGNGQLVDLGVSQYSFGESGASACTVIAATVVKRMLHKMDAGQIPDAQELVTAVQDGVTHYRTLPAALRNHMSVDELGSYMVSDVTQLGDGAIQGLLSAPNHFQDMFQQARDRAAPGKYIGLVITKPPETVCVLLPPRGAQAGAKFIFFDSHSRPQFGISGSYVVVCDDERAVVNRLSSIFTPLPSEGDEDNYMLMMYNMFEATAFQRT